MTMAALLVFELQKERPSSVFPKAGLNCLCPQHCCNSRSGL